MPERLDAGVVEGVCINRQGNYSCPVASGVIFGATMQSGAALDPSVPVFESAAMDFAVRHPANFRGCGGRGVRRLRLRK